MDGPTIFGDFSDIPDDPPRSRPRYDGAALAALFAGSLLVHVGVFVCLVVFPFLAALFTFSTAKPIAMVPDPIMVEVIELPPPPPPEPEPEPIAAGGALAKDTVGIAGSKTSKAKNKRYAIKALDKKIARNVGILGVLSSKGSDGQIQNIWGTGDDHNALGGLIGNEIGDSFGAGGLGLRGSGRGGGGTGEGTIGLGSFGTIGHGGGGSGRGYGSGRGRLGSRTRGRVRANVSASSGIDKEIVRRITRARASQVRYCYQRVLTKKPKLAGRAEFELSVGANGRVTKVVEKKSFDPEVGGCIKRVLRRTRFPAPKDGPTRVTLSYRFERA